MNFLPSDTINNPNAVENIFCKEMDKASREPLNKEDTELFINLCQSKPIPLEAVDKNDKYFLYELIEKRVQHCFGYHIIDARVIILLSQASKTAGISVMYTTYIQYLCKQNNIKKLDFKAFIDMFPLGYIPESELKSIWDKQKVSKGKDMGSDNLLDYQSAMKSIQF